MAVVGERLSFQARGLVVRMGNNCLSEVETLRLVSDSPLAPGDLRQRSEDRVRVRVGADIPAGRRQDVNEAH